MWILLTSLLVKNESIKSIKGLNFLFFHSIYLLYLSSLSGCISLFLVICFHSHKKEVLVKTSQLCQTKVNCYWMPFLELKMFSLLEVSNSYKRTLKGDLEETIKKVLYKFNSVGIPFPFFISYIRKSITSGYELIENLNLMRKPL